MISSPIKCKFAYSIVQNCLVALVLVLMLACSYHPPAPIEEHSEGVVKRQLNSDGSYYVRSGDTLYAIAFGYGLDPKSVANWNGISSPYVIYPGQKLQLSAPTSGTRNSAGSDGVQVSGIKSPGQTTTRTVTSPAPAKTVKPAPKTSAPVESVDKTSNKAATSSTKKTTTNSTGKATASKSTVVNTADPKGWKWPTKGPVRRSYVAGNPARNGVDIVGKEGQSVIASSAGQVVYSGNGLIGYGELIIIKHNDKILSAYAHNKVRLAHEGDKVSSGQKIAEMGRNASDEQILHFEIRVHGKPVNPLNYLPKK
jgi:lipoprotein NlpD